MNPLHEPSTPASPFGERAGSARELLRRIIDGDPLALFERCPRRVDERALLVDPRRAVLRSAARIAHDFATWAGEPALREWLALEIDRALDELVEEQRDEERRAEPPRESPSFAFYARVALRLRIELENARRACVALHALPLEARRVYLGVELAGRTLADLAATSGAGAHGLGRCLRDARRAVARARGTGAAAARAETARP